MGFGRVDRVDVGFGVATVCAAITAAFLTPFTRSADGTVRGWVLVGQLAAVLVTAAIPTLSAIRAKRAEQAAERREAQVRVESRVEMNQGLDPVIRKLGQLSVARLKADKERLRAQVMSLAVIAASQIVCPKPEARACYFELTPGPPKVLKPTEHHAGRMGNTRSTFVEGTPDGDAAIGMVESNDHRFCLDVVAEPPPGWNNKERDYRTFISVAVVAGRTAYGMLTVDAPEPGDLSEDDINVLRVLAGLLAASMEPPGGKVVSGRR